MYLIYSVLVTLGVILTAPYYLWRRRSDPAYAGGWRERFGFLPESFQQQERQAIWVHFFQQGFTKGMKRGKDDVFGALAHGLHHARFHFSGSFFGEREAKDIFAKQGSV